MTKLEQVRAFKEKLNENFKEIRFTNEDADKILAVLSETISETLKKGENFKIPSVGNFYSEDCPAMMRTNPYTREPIMVPARKHAKFKVSRLLKDFLK